MKPDFNAIKSSTDIVKVVEGYGIVLKQQGKDWVGLCPFHSDEDPSFRVTPLKGLFRCMSCKETGNVIQFVAKKEGINPKEAALKLLGNIPNVTRGIPEPIRPDIEQPLDPVTASALMQRVATFYHKSLYKNQAALDYLRGRKLDQPALLEHFKVGYCDGTLRNVVPNEGTLIEDLKKLGILNDKGNEFFYGRIVVPIHDSSGNVVSFYGRRLTEEMPKHLYQSGEHRGVFNGQAAKNNETLFITEAILDAMSLWSAGWPNTISLFGNGSWTPAHEMLIKENRINRIYLCLDSDESSRKATLQLKEKLAPLVPDIHVIEWPDNVKDANAFFLSREPSDFESLLQAITPQAVAIPESTAKPAQAVVERRADGLKVTLGDRTYDLCAIEQPHPGRLKATVKAFALGQAGSRFHVDSIDFYLSRSRRGFTIEVARLFRQPVEVIEEDINRIIVELESFLSSETKPAASVINETEQAEAMRMARTADLVGEILRDIEKLGLVGETTNKLVAYLVMTSRKMEDPLALQILSGSGAGKSHLQDTLLSLCPPEDLIKLTSLSDQALFYKGEDSLRHKVLALEEASGATGARYAIRNLISSKKLTIETTVKNPLTGKMETQSNTVHGPTAVFETTTDPHTDQETKSRFLLTSIDESSEQTCAILEKQRQSHTLEGRLEKKRRAGIIDKHHAFQRLLKPLVVVNPYEPLLRYGEDRLMLRRDNPKYLHLILVITFLHQYRRGIKYHAELGEYVETSLDDIALANDLALELFGQSVDELSRPSRTLLEKIEDYVEQRARLDQVEPRDVEFSRRELRESLGWSEYQLRTHLDELADMEYLTVLGGKQGKVFRYRLVYFAQQPNSKGRFINGLKSVEQIRIEAQKIGLGSSTELELRAEKENFEVTSLKETLEVNPEKPPLKVKPSGKRSPRSRGSGEGLEEVAA